MAVENTAVAGMTLPPKVEGRVNGHLVMKVDEVLWARKPPGEVTAVVVWWGAKEATNFRPSDVAENAVKRKHSGVIYEIRTSLILFEKYLHKCKNLEIAMADKYGMPIGCVSVPNLHQMISSRPYQGYYPIINNFGNRIGDLHVSFNLRMLSNPENIPITLSSNKQGVKTKDLKRLSPMKCCVRSKEEKTKKNEKVLKTSLLSSETASDIIQIDDILEERTTNLVAGAHQESSGKRVSPTSNIISHILEHGTRLRDAMAASVMEDSDQLVLDNASNLNGPSFLLREQRSLNNGGLHVRTCSDLQGYNKSTAISHVLEKKANPANEKKVMDYLSGKPMSEGEEKEALAALRSMSPTKDILDNVVPNRDQRLLAEDSLKLKDTILQESSEVVTKITDYSDDKQSIADSKFPFSVDSELLSQINCVRVTICSLILNSVGIKRSGSSFKKKRSHSQSMTILPPGSTYFVEYKFPLTGSRPWESNIRYCSKRFCDHEITFGDKTVHNLPAAWRCSITEESNLSSLLLSICFKVCARHLHQRIPIPLGSVQLDSVKPLFESVNLRHDFDLPVIAADRLPVAQLKICIELGRDRIHFGGLLDPENNSLGIRSPKTILTSAKENMTRPLSVARKKSGGRVTSVTRNISPMPSTALNLKNKTKISQATQANRLIKQLVEKATQQTQASESSSAPSTGRPHLDPLICNIPHRDWNSNAPNLQQIQMSTNNQHLKHEVALNVLRIVGINLPVNISGHDQGFFVKYRFPQFDVLKNNTVDWQTCSTDLSVCAEGIWIRPQSRVFSTVLSRAKSFHSFLQEAFRLLGQGSITFSLYTRCFGDQVQDSLVAAAKLPLSCLLTLENAYQEASRSNPKFSSSSCSSITLELPFEFLPSYDLQESFERQSHLQVKLEYRHSTLEGHNLHHKFPHSRGDSVTENITDYSVKNLPNLEAKAAPNLEQKFDGHSGVRLDVHVPSNVPNWARSPGVQIPIPPQFECSYHLEGGGNLHLNQRPDHSQHVTSLPGIFHASLDTTLQEIERLPGSCQSSGRLHLSEKCPYGHEECMVYESGTGDVNIVSQVLDQKSKGFSDLNSPGQSMCSPCNNYEVNIPLTSHVNEVQEVSLKKEDVATNTSSSLCQRNTSTRGTSPTIFPKSMEHLENEAISAEKVVSCADKLQQAVIASVNQSCQTTPRESKTPLQKDVGISVNPDEVILREEDEFCEKSQGASDVHQRCSVDDVELPEVSSKPPTGNPSNPDACVPTKEVSSPEALPVLTVSQSASESTSVAVASFYAKVGVDNALHLQTLASVSGAKEIPEVLVFVTLNPCEVDANMSSVIGTSPVSMSPAVVNNGEPEWNWQTNVQLPSDLLISTKKRLIFKIWQSEKSAMECSVQDLEQASLIGFSALDLTVLSAGLPLISGWYNIMDFSGSCHGQIKLSIEPLENISKAINFSGLLSENFSENESPCPMFIAHCAYKDFPSHVTQFPDMLVQKVNSTTSDQAASTILSSYQNVLQHCSRANSKSSFPARKDITLEETDGSAFLEDCNQSLSQSPAKNSLEAVSSHTLTNTRQQTCSAEQVLEVEKDPSVLLRERLSELESLTNTFKAKLLNRIESSRTFVAPLIPLRERTENKNKPLDQHCTKVLEPSNKWKTCACSERTECLQNDCVSEPASNSAMLKAAPKQRKTWEKHEDLIDFGALQIDDGRDTQLSPPCEDLSDWLSESALQQVFNPFLFNDLLNNMNASREVRMIELDDTETSDDNPNSPAPRPNTSSIPEDKRTSSKSSKRRTKRGDETYRKETPTVASKDVFPTTHNSGSSISACDADSGVDVDVSANFNPVAFLGAPGTHKGRYFPHSRTNVRALSSERDESSGSHSSPRHHQSTLPSSTSASATPSDSPQHSHQKRSYDER